ncbi:MAG: laccase domain-containing protein [Actinobacteria bacterium]|nr:laccase domain-containing protein [Actinomycetota bacterium]
MLWTLRTGGVSTAPYASANLATHVGDDPGAVAENRLRAARNAGLPDPDAWRFLEQVHGAGVVTVPGPPPSGSPPPRADAAVTVATGVPLVVLTADCAPVVLADDRAVGVVHAGWRGLLAGVVEAAVVALRRIGSGPVRARVGACVRPAHYEFGAEDLAAMVQRFGPTVAGRTRTGRPALDVGAAVARALAEAGVDDVGDPGWDTVGDAERWFSHRRDGTTGRQALIVVRDRP